MPFPASFLLQNVLILYLLEFLNLETRITSFLSVYFCYFVIVHSKTSRNFSLDPYSSILGGKFMPVHARMLPKFREECEDPLWSFSFSLSDHQLPPSPPPSAAERRETEGEKSICIDFRVYVGKWGVGFLKHFPIISSALLIYHMAYQEVWHMNTRVSLLT